MIQSNEIVFFITLNLVYFRVIKNILETIKEMLPRGPVFPNNN